jgi:hypothetical protein
MSGFRPIKGSAPKKVRHHGFSFASELEAALYDLLLMRERDGEFNGIRCQPQVRLTRAGIIMKPDFCAVSNVDGAQLFFEAKGFETDIYRLKRRLWEFYGPGPLEVWKGSARNPRLVEVLRPRQ